MTESISIFLSLTSLRKSRGSALRWQAVADAIIGNQSDTERSRIGGISPSIGIPLACTSIRRCLEQTTAGRTRVAQLGKTAPKPNPSGPGQSREQATSHLGTTARWLPAPRDAPVGDHPHSSKSQQHNQERKSSDTSEQTLQGGPRCACTFVHRGGLSLPGASLPARETSLVETWALCGGSFGLFFLLLLCLFFFRSPVAPLIVQHGNRVRLSCSPASTPCDVM